jgi:site-specific DNA recombinase
MSAAVIYLRVSTKKQEQRNELNLPAQQKRCDDWCRAEAIPVLKIFTGHGESAWKTDRPTLHEALDFIKKSKGEVTHFVVQDTTRFSRNDEVKAVACAVLRKLGVKLVSVDEPMLDDSPTGKLAGTMMTALGQFSSDAQSSRLRSRFQFHREAGRWLHQAPLGYRNVQQNGFKTLVHDDAAPMVRQAFEMISSGDYSSDHVRQLLTAGNLRTKKGHKLTRQTFSFMLKNPVYCGLILHKGKTYKGGFPAIVSEDLWRSAQDSLRGKRKAVPKKPTNDEFPLRGFVKCGHCGDKLTSGNARGRSKTYPRYWCWNTDCKHPVSVSKTKIEADWLDFLQRMQPAFDALANNIPILGKAYAHRRGADTANRQRQLATQLADKKALHAKLVTAKLNGEISQSDFDALKIPLAEDIAGIESAQRALESESAVLKQVTADTSHVNADAATLWIHAQLNDRQTVQSVLFPAGISYRSDIGFFEPATNEFEVMVLQGLIELAEHPEAEEILNGRGEWI